MPQTYSKILFHLVFATKYRTPRILPHLQEDLYRRFQHLSQENGGEILAAGGMPDHIHLLLETKPIVSPAELVRRIKGASSHWLQQYGKGNGESFWQPGYSIFSVSESNLPHLRSYLQNQPEHHRDRTSRHELIRLLQKHSIPHDPNTIDGDPETEEPEDGEEGEAVSPRRADFCL